MKTQLENIIRNIEERKKPNNDHSLYEAPLPSIQYREHKKEFDSLYNNIPMIMQTRNDFARWADAQEIDDATNKIRNGMDFYEDLLHNAHDLYHKYRIEGYEQGTAFDKSTTTIIHWIEKSVIAKEKLRIYINYPPAFMHRIRYDMD
jgi:hypothetical protein